MIYLTVISGLQVLAIVGLAGLWFVDRREEGRATLAERRELLTRIQRPDLVPIPKGPVPPPRPAPDPRDLMSKVGTVQFPRDD